MTKQQIFTDAAQKRLAEEGFADPSTALLRARLMLDHLKEARDLGHGWQGMLQLSNEGLYVLDRAEAVAASAYRSVREIERAGGDQLAGHSAPAGLVRLLRQAQAERDELVTANLKLESRLTVAEIAIHTAQEEDRAPTWPPAESTGHGAQA